MPERLVFKAERQVETECFEIAGPGPEEIVLETEVSMISPGTERIVFNRLFEEGTHWAQWVKYPFYPGYAAVGRVIDRGEAVDDMEVGDRVVSRVPHASHHVADRAQCYRVPDTVGCETASWFALAKIAFMGALCAGYSPGDSVLIIGAGPVGQLSVRWAAVAGALPVIAVDMLQERLGYAEAGGAGVCIAKPVEESVDEVMEATRGAGPGVVIDGTGNDRVFTAALDIAARFATVVLLGDTGTPSAQHLNCNVIVKGLKVIGAFDVNSVGEWPESRIVDLFFSMVEAGRYSVDGLITHRFAPGDCAEAYRLITGGPGGSMGVIFDWR